MSWLEPAGRGRGDDETITDQQSFWRAWIAVERDLDTGEFVRVPDAAGCYWVYAWSSHAAIAQKYGIPAEQIDAAEMRGAKLRDRLRAYRPDTGIVFRRGDDELVMLRPQQQPTHRVALD